MAPILVTVGTFSIYFGIYGALSPAAAFTSLSLFNILRQPLIILPMLMSSLADVKIATKRISKFLLIPEIEQVKTLPKGQQDDPSGTVNKVGVIISNGKFFWPPPPPIEKSRGRGGMMGGMGGDSGGGMGRGRGRGSFSGGTIPDLARMGSIMGGGTGFGGKSLPPVSSSGGAKGNWKGNSDNAADKAPQINIDVKDEQPKKKKKKK